MYEPVYSAQGGPPKGYVCRVLVTTAKGKQRFCNKPCKTLHGMQRHGLLKHGMKLQQEMFDAEKVQRQANDEYVRAASEHDAERTSGDASTLDLFAAARRS